METQRDYLNEQVECFKAELLRDNQIKFETLEATAKSAQLNGLIKSKSSSDSLNSSSVQNLQVESSTPNQIQQQTVAAAAVVSSTLAVVAAVSLAAANVQRNSINQTNEET